MVGDIFASLNCFGGIFRRDKQSEKNGGKSREDLSIIRGVKVYSYKDLKLATRDFHPDNKIGAGGFGTVYKGVLKDGTEVAIKQLSAESKQGVREFLTEIATISAIKHENLVILHGCCVEGYHRILVYGYLENNSISHALFGSHDASINLDWKARSKICIGTARGFAYLHEEVRPHIVHRDIKASNILLDRDLNPKIADFGLAKLFPDNITHISTRVAGTIGYLAPEYAMRGQLTKKADIYSFGVLVLRHCDEDLIIRGLIKALPFSIENLKLKKMILLKKISLEVSKGSISEKTLKTLRSLMDLNRQICRDSDNEKAMQELCCKVAVECTAKHLRGTCEIDWNGYNGALRRLWSHSIEDTEDVEMDGGVSDIKKELLDVASNPSLRGRILEKYRQEDVLKRLNAFIEDSWKEMGPTFIETVAEDVAQGRYNPLGGRGSIPAVDSATMAAPSSETGSPPCNVPEKNEETTSTFPPCNVPENNEETASTYPPCNVPENNKETASTFPPCNVPENNEETASTFPPPWADVHPSSGPDMSKERKRMARNLKANQAISSEMKALGSSNGQPLSDRKFRDCQPNAINLEENEISGQDISIRTEATAAQEGGKESAPDLDDVNAHGRCRLGTYHISNNKRLLTPEYVKVNEELSRSTSELHLHVEDPLPNALKFAEGCMSRQEGFPTAVHLDGNKQLENPINEVEKGVLPESTTGVVNQVQNTEERGSGHQSGKSGRESVQFNIMDRNPTARTFQWDENDSIDSPEDNSPSASRKVRLPTPVRVHVSPLKRPRTAGDFAYRRKPTKWSVLEEETLKKEVARYGKGRWKYILEKNRETFEERTEVDLKDKWRNIERREGLHAP